VGVALLHDEFYLLSLREIILFVCKVNEQISASEKEQKKRKGSDESSKLWHCRLGHILRGRIENLLKMIFGNTFVHLSMGVGVTPTV
jgi:hypothetical protein